MALVKCKECGASASDRTLICPNCNCPFKSSKNLSARIPPYFMCDVTVNSVSLISAPNGDEFIPPFIIPEGTRLKVYARIGPWLQVSTSQEPKWIHEKNVKQVPVPNKAKNDKNPKKPMPSAIDFGRFFATTGTDGDNRGKTMKATIANLTTKQKVISVGIILLILTRIQSGIMAEPYASVEKNTYSKSADTCRKLQKLRKENGYNFKQFARKVREDNPISVIGVVSEIENNGDIQLKGRCAVSFSNYINDFINDETTTRTNRSRAAKLSKGDAVRLQCTGVGAVWGTVTVLGCKYK